MLTNWNNFNSLYIEPMNKLMDEYTTKINDTMRSWWGQNHTSGVRVLVTTDTATDVIQIYSLKAYSEGFPDKADNGETVNKDWSIGVPAEYIPKTSAMTFDVNTYREDFKKAMVERLKAAVADNKLDGGSAFVGNAPKNEKLYEQYAEYVMNAIIYEAACYKMSHDSVWVTSVVNAYKNYCSNLLVKNSGVNAFLNYLYQLHGFEGEIKEDIERFCNQMIFYAGYYGEFALTCVGQDSLQTKATLEDVQELFTDTILHLDEVKNKAITGHDNYCYITGTILAYETVTAKSSIEIDFLVTKHDDDGFTKYDDFKSHSWEISVPTIADPISLSLIYRQFLMLPNGARCRI